MLASTALLAANLATQALTPLFHLGSQFGAEVLRLEYLPDLDFRLALMRIRAALHPFNRLFHRPDLPYHEACDEFLALGERAVDPGALVSGKAYPLALRTRLQSAE